MLRARSCSLEANLWVGRRRTREKKQRGFSEGRFVSGWEKQDADRRSVVVTLSRIIATNAEERGGFVAEHECSLSSLESKQTGKEEKGEQGQQRCKKVCSKKHEALS
jgi:hypothetical protein